MSKETSPSIVMGPRGRQTHTMGDTHQTHAMHRTGKQAREIFVPFGRGWKQLWQGDEIAQGRSLHVSSLRKKEEGPA